MNMKPVDMPEQGVKAAVMKELQDLHNRRGAGSISGGVTQVEAPFQCQLTNRKVAAEDCKAFKTLSLHVQTSIIKAICVVFAVVEEAMVANGSRKEDLERVTASVLVGDEKCDGQAAHTDVGAFCAAGLASPFASEDWQGTRTYARDKGDVDAAISRLGRLPFEKAASDILYRDALLLLPKDVIDKRLEPAVNLKPHQAFIMLGRVVHAAPKPLRERVVLFVAVRNKMFGEDFNYKDQRLAFTAWEDVLVNLGTLDNELKGTVTELWYQSMREWEKHYPEIHLNDKRKATMAARAYMVDFRRGLAGDTKGASCGLRLPCRRNK